MKQVPEKTSILGGGQGVLARRREWAWLAALLLFGLWVRAYKLGEFPLTWSYDEVDVARLSQAQVLESGRTPLFMEDFHNPGMSFWVGGLVCKLFGTSVNAMRGLSAFWGWMALLPFYFLSRRLLGPRWALAALALFCAMRWTLIPQRIAFTSSFALFWVLGASYFMWLALDTGRLRDCALAGLGLGLCLHAYNPSRMMILIWLLFGLFHLKKIKAWPWKARLAFAGCFLAAAGPMFFYMATHWHSYIARTQGASILNDVRDKGWGQLWMSFSKHLLCFNVSGDQNARHNIHGWPQLDGITGLLFIPAVLWTHWRWRQDPRALLFFLWFWVMLSQGIFSMASEAPQANRSILVTPVLALMPAFFLAEMAKPWRGAWAGLGLTLLLAAVPLLNAHEVLVAWTHDPATGQYFAPEATSAARRAAASGRGWLVYHAKLYQAVDGYPQFERDFFIRFLLKQQGRELHELGYPSSGVEIPPGPPPQGVLAIWAKTDTIITDAVRAQYPGLKPEPSPPSEPRFEYWTLEIPWERIPGAGKKGAGHPLFVKGFRMAPLHPAPRGSSPMPDPTDEMH